MIKIYLMINKKILTNDKHVLFNNIYIYLLFKLFYTREKSASIKNIFNDIVFDEKKDSNETEDINKFIFNKKLFVGNNNYFIKEFNVVIEEENINNINNDKNMEDNIDNEINSNKIKNNSENSTKVLMKEKSEKNNNNDDINNINNEP